MKALLVQYSLELSPLVLPLPYTPEKLQRSRTVTITAGSSAATRLGYDFTTPVESARAAQSAQLQAESITLDTLFDAIDRIADGDPTAIALGVRPELDTLRTMLMPKSHMPAGAQLLAGIGGSSGLHETPSVILFFWGPVTLPVFITSVMERAVHHNRALVPIRAEVSITMQVIESRNPITKADRTRQLAMTRENTIRLAAGAIGSRG